MIILRGHNERMKFSACAIAATAAVFLAACSSHQQQQASNAATSVSHAATHGYIVAAVMAKLTAVDVDAASDVHVASANGVVTLTGQAHSAAERARYAKAAGSVSGVKSVVNDLAVNPNTTGVREETSDGALDAKVVAAIAAQAGINVFHASPHVHNGIVTLTGTVPSRSVEKTIVATTRKVTGVKGVVNDLVIR